MAGNHAFAVEQAAQRRADAEPAKPKAPRKAKAKAKVKRGAKA